MTSISDGSLPEPGLSDDRILGGRVALWQPRRGYRAGIDPVLLAAATPAKPGQSVLELGAGVGAAFLCLAARVPELAITAVEVQGDYAELANRNAARNGCPAEIVTADLRALPPSVKQVRFDHVIANPPYFDRDFGSPSPDKGRNLAFAGDTPMRDWVDTASRRLAPKGWLTMIQKAARLPEVLAALEGRLGSVRVLPLAGRAGRPADRFLLWARKEGKAPFRLEAPLVLHEGQAHLEDAEDYREDVRAILRDAKALPVGD
ncbi:methyltransferase [Ponticoccus sp. SC2-23]|uniref:tRNA1(Val) (adenine(37)-N6)-methyltransferase n=1 Tax=Alexandriicola marinus TaxID=2081710 RepID=UPI000FD732DD|nr:methyltransferase [Alexandriicola marinus]MBM1220375.1 methyltransferase [Ponticoccus sp. SC6-9]MBM1225061.1 methyltransferase [Ponticoccus sp. SC6-15]MBM1228575.1 methyltransferase [Ponticoccus sp. SC6-38]MBM1233788.1 methyltransferase [Ponticoccus sp. SC6-45]MBM1239076.1 methyltransferase [Ponticoccus sp. SC6-49]MBM1242858.1 methyltransferase [Ponticoccus sp. SC2-64]MBM1247312.1 methyltransferase [Ponticoccus sp. SC6-42]MBM1252029.1 methyltransferase [Ponticoccus sp. SC6-33]MBM1257085